MMDSTLLSTLEQAVSDGKLLATSLENIQLLLAGTKDPVAPAAVSELTSGTFTLSSAMSVAFPAAQGMEPMVAVTPRPGR